MLDADGGAEGGEVACYLHLLDADGEMPDARSMIRLVGEGVAPAARRVVHLTDRSGADVSTHLVPGPGETAEEYACRLETPVCRTAAWGLVLAAQDQPIDLDFGDEIVRGKYGPILLSYLRALIE